MQPGQTVSPGGAQETPTWQFNPESQPQTTGGQSQPSRPKPNEPLPPVQATPSLQPAQRDHAAAASDSAAVTWTASEFIAHAKTGGWYMLLGVGAVVLAAAVFLLTKDMVSTVVILFVAIIFGISAARKPRELQYRVDDQGVHIGEKTYPYATLRSFAVVEEGAVESIWFMPLKRFRPIVGIYFDPNDGGKIADILSQFLPFEDRQPDPVDRLMHRIRF